MIWASSYDFLTEKVGSFMSFLQNSIKLLTINEKISTSWYTIFYTNLCTGSHIFEDKVSESE